MWHEAGPEFNDHERAALLWAETVTRLAKTSIPDQDYPAGSAVFGKKQIVDLTIAIGLMNTFNRIAIAFRRPPHVALSAPA